MSLDISEGEDLLVDLKLNDQVNEAYTLIYATASFISPLIGSYIYQSNANCMRTTFDIVAVGNFIYAVILFTFNCGPNVFIEDRDFRKKLESLEVEKD